MTALPFSGPSPGFDAGRFSLVTRLLNRGVESGTFPGAVAAVAQGGRLAYLQAVGQQQVAPEPRDRMPVDAIFDLASVTKPVATGTALGLLIEDGVLTLDDYVSEYVPEFRDRDKAVVRIRHLASHTSGVQSNPKLYHEHESWETLLPAYLALPLIGTPGSLFLYSSINFIILGLIIERASGRSLDALLAERVFRPLGMNDTIFNPPAELRPRIPATEYVNWRDEWDWGVVNDKTAQMMGGVSGHAGLFSTASDLALFGQALLNGGTLGDTRFLSPSGSKLLLNQWTDERGVRRGVCWLPGSQRTFGDLLGPLCVGHTGTTGTAMCIVPSDDMTVVLLTNRVHPTRDNDLIERFRPKFFNTVAAARTNGPSR
jgi:CubicO group peptidase (beta-lactamase class C family)